MKLNDLFTKTFASSVADAFIYRALFDCFCVVSGVRKIIVNVFVADLADLI